ncbi:hypothetical protein A0J48_004395 [Sphaerospermopsis aphanizomenoides BCCUSP55]|uniref:hypothetical protein n=1 Tax=Sphaerospermopsis aphanizomenoides TaxID=459663 RepID=UPI001904C40E|nr:hypothetical protein [Sphaerospermopsis aphanizomenoides]MBK1986789.1 hypothetical protein [Sphaerospermopsis aphanizomenoides BCCUSP55]
MTSNLKFKKFSDNLTNSLTDIYRIGNLSLVFMLGGVIVTIVGHFVNDWLFSLGICLIIGCLGFFIYAQIQGFQEISRLIEKNKTSIDLAQETAIELTKTVNLMESFTISHIKALDKTTDMVVPLVTTLPIVGRKLDNMGISKLQNVSKHLVEMMLKLENITQDMEKSLVNADAQKLAVYTQKLRKISQKIRTNSDQN